MARDLLNKVCLIGVLIASLLLCGCDDAEDDQKRVSQENHTQNEFRAATSPRSESEYESAFQRLSEGKQTEDERYKDLISVCENASIENLEKIWAVVAEGASSSQDKAQFKHMILRNLAREGESGPVLAFVLQNCGAGIERCNFISSVFSGRLLSPSEANDLVSQLEHPSEVDAAVRGMGAIGLGIDSLPTLLSYFERPEKYLQDAAIGALSSMPWSSRDPGIVIPEVFDAVSKLQGEMRVKFLNKFLSEGPRRVDPYLIIDEIEKKVGLEEFKNLESPAKERIIANMTVEDAPRSMRKILEMGKDFDPELSTSYYLWFRQDVEKASKWFEQNRSTLDPSQSDLLIGTMINEAIQRKELDTAEDWMKELSDENEAGKVAAEIREARE